MGNTPSAPSADRLCKAVTRNNVQEVQDLCRQLAQSAPPTRAKYFEFKDSEGRTPLVLAVQKNNFAIAKLLLEQGANVNACMPAMRPWGGSALHEAVNNRSSTMVELLIAHKANPFIENTSGKTAMDNAVSSGLLPIVRLMERAALFSGYINMKVQQYVGMATTWKDRWCVIMPRYTTAVTTNAGNVQQTIVVRVMLWIYKDASSVEMRTKVWLDGAVAFLTSDGGVVRLHPNHEEPERASTKYERGYMLFFRKAASNGANSGDDFKRFIATCAQPFSNTAAQYPSLAGPPPQPPTAGAEPTSPHNYIPAVHPPPQALPAQPQPGPAATAAAASAGEATEFQARPGESDVDFARRLAAWYATPSGGAGADGSSCGAVDRPPHYPGSRDNDAPMLSHPLESIPSTSSALEDGSSRPAAAAAASSHPSAPMLYPSLQQPAGPLASSTAGAAGSGGGDGEGELCVICLANPKQVGFLHGSSVHRCVCNECAQLMRVGQACPMCRQPIERVLGVF